MHCPNCGSECVVTLTSCADFDELECEDCGDVWVEEYPEFDNDGDGEPDGRPRDK